MVYGPLGEVSLNFLRSLLFLLLPYITFTFIRFVVSRQVLTLPSETTFQ